MGEKKKVYHALVDGATAGLTDKALFDYVQKECPKTSSKRIVRASLLALSDPDLRDGNILNTIYALAIKHRLDQVDDDHDHDHDEIHAEPTPSIATKHEDKPAGKRKGGKKQKAAESEPHEPAQP